MFWRPVSRSRQLPAMTAGAGAMAPEVRRPDERPDPDQDALILASVAPLPRTSTTRAPDRRCTQDGAHCISRANYIPDVCRTIEAVATSNGVDKNFFARLIWKESLFDAGAVSPAGAQGIAQFMPGTAKLRGLRDAFNPAAALSASAEYLAELSRTYGNPGLAAAAYNGGEARVDRYLSASGGLPTETRAYVHAITGHSVETWRDAPPETLDVALDKKAEFQTACVTLASNRGLRDFRSAPPVMPWGVILASNRDQGRGGAAGGAPAEPPCRGPARRAGRLHSRPSAGNVALAAFRPDRPRQPRRSRGPLYPSQIGRRRLHGVAQLGSGLRRITRPHSTFLPDPAGDTSGRCCPCNAKLTPPDCERRSGPYPLILALWSEESKYRGDWAAIISHDRREGACIPTAINRSGSAAARRNPFSCIPACCRWCCATSVLARTRLEGIEQGRFPKSPATRDETEQPRLPNGLLPHEEMTPACGTAAMRPPVGGWPMPEQKPRHNGRIRALFWACCGD